MKIPIKALLCGILLLLSVSPVYGQHYNAPSSLGNRRHVDAHGATGIWDMGRSNLLANSTALNLWSRWTAPAIDSALAPDGTMTAEVFAFDGGANRYVAQNIAVLPSREYAACLWTRLASGSFDGADYFRIELNDGSGGGRQVSLLNTTSTWQEFCTDGYSTYAANPATSNVTIRGSGFTATVEMWMGRLMEGPRQPYSGQDYTTGTFTVTDLSGNGHTLTLAGSFVPRNAGVTLNGTTSAVIGLPAKGAAWTVIQADDTTVYGIDSDGGSYVNGVAQAGATEWDLATPGAYVGTVSYVIYKDYVLSPQEQADAYTEIKNQLHMRHRSEWYFKPVISMGFDDGSLTQLTIMKPVYDAKGVYPYTAITTGFIGNEGSLTWEQVGELATAGWEIVSHTKTHPDLRFVDFEQLTDEVLGSKQILESHGFSAHNIAYPSGQQNAAVQTETAKYYRLGRAVNQLPNRNLPLEKYNLAAISADDEAQLESYKGFVDECKARSEWCIFYQHWTTAEDATAIAELIDYVTAAGVPIKTMSRAADYLTAPPMEAAGVPNH